MDAEGLKVVRGIGWVLVAFSLLMLAMIPFIGPVMAWMDVPMLLVGIGVVGWASWKLRQVHDAP